VESLVSAIAQHGYSILFFVVLAEAMGLPVPAAVGLLVAGGASASHHLNAGQALLFAVSAMLLGDNLLFLLGRWTGWWLLGVLCRISLNPEACIMKSADSFLPARARDADLREVPAGHQYHGAAAGGQHEYAARAVFRAGFRRGCDLHPHLLRRGVYFQRFSGLDHARLFDVRRHSSAG
jgi:hypothetical protein